MNNYNCDLQKLIKCYICDQNTNDYCKNIFQQQSKHSETLIYKFLEKFVGNLILENEYKLNNHEDRYVICKKCVFKIDDYDLAILTAQHIENDLIQLLSKTNKKYQNNIEVIISNKKNTTTVSGSGKEIFIVKERYDVNNYKNEDETSNLTVASCTKAFKDLQVKQKPEKRKNSSDKIIYKCSKCDHVSQNKRDLRKHIKTHDDKQQYICDICGQTFKTVALLKSHSNNVHHCLTQFECDICGKKFKRRIAVVQHMPIHSGVIQYQCEICGKDFIHHTSFRLHKLAHDNIRQKKCKICGLELRSNSHLTRHLRVHSGEKPYTCPTCGKKFAQRYNMKLHYRKAHLGIDRITNKSRNTTKSTKLTENYNSCSSNTTMTSSSVLQNTLKENAGTTAIIKTEKERRKVVILPITTVNNSNYNNIVATSNTTTKVNLVSTFKNEMIAIAYD